MVPCQSCGEYIEDSGRFCPYCGAEQSVIQDTAEVVPVIRPTPAQTAPADELAVTQLIQPGSASASLADGLDKDTFKDPVALGAAGRASVSAAAGHTRVVSDGGRYDVGDVVEHYRIESVLGTGGMGQVFRAVHALTGQEVALKMLHQEKNDTPTDRARFLNEARVLAQLDHPNLVPMLGFIEQPTGVFIVLPFIDGETLEERLEREGRPELNAALSIFDQLCEGLAWLHEEKQILHRDLKPSNVMMTDAGVVKLTDFGIAREVGAKAMTAAGMVVGTAEYLAPERAAGTLRDDPRSDLYGLAVMLYELLTGQPPFRDANAAKVMLKHLNHPPPPPRGINPMIPVSLEVELLKALAKEPDARHPSVSAFRAAVAMAVDQTKKTIPLSSHHLEAAVTAAGTAPRDASSSPPRKVSVMGYILRVALLGVLGGLGYGAYLFFAGGGS